MLPRGSSELSPDYARDTLKSIEIVLSRQQEQAEKENDDE
jgi:hypothetical protein